MAARKYKLLSQMPAGTLIQKCAQMLPNRLQCWKAGEVEVTEIGADDKEFVYQLCRQHAVIQQRTDSQTAPPLAQLNLNETDAPPDEGMTQGDGFLAAGHPIPSLDTKDQTALDEKLRTQTHLAPPQTAPENTQTTPQVSKPATVPAQPVTPKPPITTPLPTKPTVPPVPEDVKK
jgi:hypothetical protein